tara:strand:+ start:1450 stop:1644 length:195 start_codon:yes stop_codon:yes gene_type:complete
MTVECHKKSTTEFIMANLPIYLTLPNGRQGKKIAGTPKAGVTGAGNGGAKEYPNAGTRIIRNRL